MSVRQAKIHSIIEKKKMMGVFHKAIPLF